MVTQSYGYCGAQSIAICTAKGRVLCWVRITKGNRVFVTWANYDGTAFKVQRLTPCSGLLIGCHAVLVDVVHGNLILRKTTHNSLAIG